MLKIRTGPMFSGKTTWLVKKLQKENGKILKITFFLDDRKTLNCDSNTSTHNKNLNINIKNTDYKKVKNLFECKDIDKYDIIGIDEAQFFEDLVEFVDFCLKKGKKVYCVGLNLDFNKNIFGKIHLLKYLSSEYKVLSSKCYFCGKEANFTKLFLNKTNYDENILIGGDDIYKASCDTHHS